MSSNNPYDKESGVLGGLVKTAALGGVGYVAYKGISDPESMDKVITKAVNKFFPVKDSLKSLRERQAMLGSDALRNAAGRRATRGKVLDSIFANDDTLQIKAHGMKFGTANTTGTRPLETFNLNMVKDIHGKAIGEEAIKSKVAKAFRMNSKDLSVSFDGTVAKFVEKSSGEELVNIPFSEMDDVTGTWRLRRGDAYYQSHLQAKHITGKEGLEGINIVGPNEEALDILGNKNKRILLAAKERDRIDVWNQLKMGPDGKGRINDEVRRNLNKKADQASLTKLFDDTNIKRQLKQIYQESFFDSKSQYAAHDTITPRLRAFHIKPDAYTTFKLGEMPGFEGFANSFISAKTLNNIGADGKRINSGGFKQWFGLGAMIKDKMKVLRIGGVDGRSYSGFGSMESARDMIYDGFLGPILNQEHTAEKWLGVANTGAIKSAEMMKSHKGLRWDFGIGQRNSFNRTFGKGSMVPITYNPKIFHTGQKLYGPQAGEAATVRRGGFLNVYGSYTPFTDESITFTTKELSNLKAKVDVTDKFDELLIGADDATMESSKVNVSWMEGKTRRYESMEFHKLFGNKGLEANAHKGMSIEGRKGTLLGRGSKIAKSYDNDFFEAITNPEGGSLIRTKADFKIEGNALRDFFEKNKQVVDEKTGNLVKSKISFFAEAIDHVAKIAIRNVKDRATPTLMLDGNQDKYHQLLTQALGITRRNDMYISSNMVSKTLPSVLNGNLAMGKQSPETIEFLLNSIQGHVKSYSDMGYNITLSGDAYQQMSPYMRYDPSKKVGANLTKAVKSGRLGFINAGESNASAEQLAQQYSDTANFWATLRERVITSKGKNINIDKIETGLLGNVSRDWNAMGSLAKNVNDVTDPYERGVFTRVWNKTASKEDTMRLHFPTAASIAPQEATFLAQGGAYNDLKLQMRDMWHFQYKPEILEELYADARIDSMKIGQEARMMNESFAGKNIDKALSTFEEANGIKIPTLSNREDFARYMGGLGVERFDEIMEDPKTFMNTFMSRDVNPYGFKMKTDDGFVYVGSADTVGGGTYLPSKERMTTEGIAAKTYKMLQEGYKRGGLRVETRQGFSEEIIESLGDSHGELAKRTQITVDRARYSKVKYDINGINNELFKNRFRADTFAGADDVFLRNLDDVNTLIGSTIKVGEGAFTQDFQSIAKEHIAIARENNRTLQEQLSYHFGEGNEISQHMTDLHANSTPEEIKSAAQKFTDIKLAHAEDIASDIGRIQSISEKGLGNISKGEMDEVSKLMESLKSKYKTALVGEVQRDPLIFAGSDAYGFYLPTAGNKAKEVSIGGILLRNLAADADGDGIKVRMLLTRGSRKRVEETLLRDQKEIAGWLGSIKKFGESLGGKAAFELLETDAQRIQAFKMMAEEHPLATAFASVATKGLTGSMNRQAILMKATQNNMINGMKATDDELRRMHNFNNTMTSRLSEQESISSKHILRIMDQNALGKPEIETMMDLLNGMTASDYKEALQETKGKLNPLMIFPLMDEKASKEIGAETVSMLKDYNDLTIGWQAKSEERIRQIGSQIMGITDDTELDTFAKQLMRPKESYFMSNPLMQKFNPENKSYIDWAWAPAYKESTKYNTFAGDSFNQARTMARSQLSAETGINTSELEIDAVNRRTIELYDKRSLAGYGNQLIEDEVGRALRQKSSRTIWGANKLQDAFDWMLRPGNAKRVGWGALGGAVAIAAINTVFGDGAPENPNDLPSVNNPSFQSSGYNFGGGVAISGQPGYNSSVSLLTDNTVPYNTALSHVSSLLGGSPNTVSVRHDGTDPYKLDMMMYK